MTASKDDMNAALRRARGVATPQDTAEAELAALGDDATDAQRVAVAAGLPLAYARRLRGDTIDDLAADVVDLLAGLAELAPPPPPVRAGAFGGGVRGVVVREEPTMNDVLRSAVRTIKGAPSEVDIANEMRLRMSQP